MTPDLIIQGGTIVDGTGRSGYLADIAVFEGRVAAIGTFDSLPGVACLDAHGLTVTPGFIDIHSHSDFTLLIDPRAISAIAQGVTTEVVGNCGHGCAPIADAELVKSNIYGYREGFDLSWRGVGEYLERLEAVQPAVNVLTLVPNGNLRLAAVGLKNRPATLDELRRMQKLLHEGLEEGAFGFSTGLEYETETGCSESEIVALCATTAAVGGFYATHTRNRDNEAEETIAEAIRTANKSDLPLQISHISVVARLEEDGGQAVEQALKQVDIARSSGGDVTFDMHTRLFGTTNLSAALPAWALEGTRSQIAERLQTPSTRRDLKQHRSIVTALAGNDWSQIVVSECKAHPEYCRQDVQTIARTKGVSPLDAVYDLLNDDIEDLHSLMIVAHSYREEEIRAAFEHPECMVGSDATTLSPDGPLANTIFHGAYTWASWFLRHFARDKKLLTLEEAVRRITSLPASRLGVSDRGTIEVGSCADISVFDPQTYAEQGTTFDPNQLATGMVHVVVNGIVAMNDSRLTNERGGQVLRRNN